MIIDVDTHWEATTSLLATTRVPRIAPKERNAEPIALYRPGLDSIDGAWRASFMGENMQRCYARMGDPL